MVALLREGTVIKVMLQRFLLPQAIVWPGFVENGFSYNLLAAAHARARAQVIQMLSEFWATVQMSRVSLATLSPCLAWKPRCYGQN